MRSRIYSTEAREHYDELLAAIGSRPVEPERWIARREARRQARTARQAALRRLVRLRTPRGAAQA